MQLPDAKKLAELLAQTLKRSLEEKLMAVVKRLGDLETAVRIASAPERGEPGHDGVAGKSAYELAVDRGFTGSLDEWLVSLRGKDGLAIKGDPGKNGEPGKDGLSVKGDPGKNGEPGEPGRDAMQIEILPYIEEDRSYGRGTYASYKGGVIRAARTTDYLDTLKAGETIESKGWQIILAGIAEQSIEQIDERTFTIKLTDTTGRITERKVAMPVMIYRGVWREDEYQRGDTTTWAGSLWHCEEPTRDKPGTSKAWKLAVKKGADGKDGVTPKSSEPVRI